MTMTLILFMLRQLIKLFLSSNYKIIIFNFANNNIHISAVAQDSAISAEDNVEAKVDGDGLEISFNYKYILDVLKALRHETLTIELSDNCLNPIKVTCKNLPDYIYVCTPVRTK